jgi:hypothetical protein
MKDITPSKLGSGTYFTPFHGAPCRHWAKADVRRSAEECSLRDRADFISLKAVGSADSKVLLFVEDVPMVVRARAGATDTCSDG